MTHRVLLVEDHEVVRVGVRALLERQGTFAICGEASHGRQALDLAASLSPDMVILDVGIPGLNGLEVTRRLRDLAPRAAVVILSNHAEDVVVREAIAAGAKAYVLKDDAASDLVLAAESVCAGRPFFSARVAHAVLAAMARGPAASPTVEGTASSLTPRERETLQLLCEGQSCKEVAGVLGVSVKTAETHRANIMKKLGLRSLAELVKYALKNHLVEP